MPWGDEAHEAFVDDGVMLNITVVLVQLSAVVGSLCVCCLLTPAQEDHGDMTGEKLVRGSRGSVRQSRAAPEWKRVHRPVNR